MQKPVAYICYAPTFVESESGIAVRLYLTNELRTLVLKKERMHDFTVFTDYHKIKDWNPSSEKSRTTLKFLIPILNQSFFRNRECRIMAKKFLIWEDRLERQDLILPIYYPEGENESLDEEDTLIVRLRLRHWFRLSDPQHGSNDDLMRRGIALAIISDNIAQTIREWKQATEQEVSSVSGVSSGPVPTLPTEPPLSVSGAARRQPIGLHTHLAFIKKRISEYPPDAVPPSLTRKKQELNAKIEGRIWLFRVILIMARQLWDYGRVGYRRILFVLVILIMMAFGAVGGIVHMGTQNGTAGPLPTQPAIETVRPTPPPAVSNTPDPTNSSGHIDPTPVPTDTATPAPAPTPTVPVTPTLTPVVPTFAPTDTPSVPTPVPTDTITPEPAPTVTVAPSPTLPFSLPTMVAVPGGLFTMGSSATDPTALPNEQEPHQLELDAYWIGKTEVTNAQFRPFVEGGGYDTERYWTRPGRGWRQTEERKQPKFWDDETLNGDNQPVVGVTLHEVQAYVQWLNEQADGREYRLPTEAEWERVARGADSRIYPWGDTWEPSRANSVEAAQDATLPVGSYPNGASPDGLLDMAGNAWEWTCSLHEAYPYEPEERDNACNELSRLQQSGADFTIRGGGWLDNPDSLRAARRIGKSANYADRQLGFRLACDSDKCE